MEYAATPARPRRLLRTVPWLLAMGLFAGGGYSVYKFGMPTAADLAGGAPAAAASTADASAGIPASSLANSPQIKQLFSSTETQAAALPIPAASAEHSRRYTSLATAPSAAPAYAPPAPDAVATPRSAAAIAEVQNPFSPPRAAGEPAVAPAGMSAAPAIASPQPYDLARGQEPTSENPLRGGTAIDSAAARAAFEAQAPIAQPQSMTPASAEASPPAMPANNASESPAAGANPFTRYAAAPVPAGASAGPGEAPSADAMFAHEPPAPVPQSAAAPEPAGAEPAATDPPAAEQPMPLEAPTRFSPASAKPLRPQHAEPQSFAAEAAQEPAAAVAMATSTPPTPPSAAAPPHDLGAAALAPAEATITPGINAIEGAGRPGDRSLEGVQVPTLTIQKLAPPEVQVGKNAKFAVKVQNTSRIAAHNVQIHDEIPLGAQLLGSAPKAAVAGSQLVWDLGTLAAGEERIVEMDLLPTTEGELGSVATVTFAAQASAKSRCTRPELQLRLTAGPRVMIGQQHIVQIQLTNPGSGDATGVMLLENVPPGVQHDAGPALEFEVGTLKAGETKQLDLVLTAAEAGRINNVMTARADAGLEVQAECEFEVIAPKLAVSVEGPSRRYLERPATYTVNIENPGTAPAKEVQLITQLPPGLKFQSANNLGEYDAATHSVHWSLAELPANERGTVQLTALPVQAGEHKLQIASRAEQGLEERTETMLLVEGLVALSFDVDAADGAIEVGGETAYDVTVRNLGSKAAANVQVAAVIPPGLRATGGEGATRHVVEGDRLLFAPIPQLPPKGEAKYRVKVQGLRAGDQRTQIMVTADEVQDPITKEESTRVYADQ